MLYQDPPILDLPILSSAPNRLIPNGPKAMMPTIVGRPTLTAIVCPRAKASATCYSREELSGLAGITLEVCLLVTELEREHGGHGNTPDGLGGVNREICEAEATGIGLAHTSWSARNSSNRAGSQA